MTSSTIWLGIGLLGQALFSMRFLVQWIVSEYSRRSILPQAFWYFSVLGGVTLLAYAIHQREIVFIIGQAMGLLIYARNIMLSRQPAAVERAG
ncbi:lipid-A-disaccharide synthase N-terminal domain-containing protein [Mesorhizobium sp.]|uniref:lipid-A-disaccharide synthase N-terminal domain-containing protein n=1 Tax=Mesorhizobium sp. TaxID=1871066 RepID=UPI000FE93304|nr:lipid-A-disaccharide synthase N-terminal domain-containing protein [Mesorhizobium sp.]RWP27035.1 MAG: lipid A biosynthesis protein [Mesorhizobium sp.]TIL63344.1 MAG: lipid A biosynthesis protein [Mesorhizobium sp.]